MVCQTHLLVVEVSETKDATAGMAYQMDKGIWNTNTSIGFLAGESILIFVRVVASTIQVLQWPGLIGSEILWKNDTNTININIPFA